MIIELSTRAKQRFVLMFRIMANVVRTLSSSLRSRSELVLENMVLRQQLATFKARGKRPRIRAADRAFWVVLRRLWARWADALVIVKPDTVVRWHRTGFRLYQPRRPTVLARTKVIVFGVAAKRLRARVSGDLDRLRGLLPELGETICTPRADYPFRAMISKAALIESIGNIVETIDYSNFKATVGQLGGHRRAHVHSAVWRELLALESLEPGVRRRR